MSGLVSELQRDALDGRVSTAELLRKALVVTKKLNLLQIQRWIELELKGYYGSLESIDSLPEYRKAHGELKCFNAVRGRWQPVIIEDEELYQNLTDNPILQSIAEIDDLLSHDSNGYHTKFDGVTAAQIMRMIGYDLEPAVFLPKQILVRVIDGARNKILDWALDLEAKGILGEGMSFSKEEKLAASAIHYSTVNNIGSMNNSQLQQNSSGSQSIVVGDSLENIKGLVEGIEAVIDILKLELEKKEELISEINSLKIQIASPKPKSTVIKECLASVRTILEGAAGNVLASGLALQIPQLIASLPQ